MDILVKRAQLESIRWAAAAKVEWVSIELTIAETEIRLFKAKESSKWEEEDQLTQAVLAFWKGRSREAFNKYMEAEQYCGKYLEARNDPHR